MGDWVTEDLYQHVTEPLLVVISGPSGVGKDSVVHCLKECGYPFHFVVTATSRPPRAGEVHGVDYFFVSEREFERLIVADELIEHALVYGQYKGVPKQQVREALASGKDVLMRLDVQGAATVRQLAPEAVLIFLSPSSEEELVARLRQRQGDTEAQLAHRIQMIREEMRCLPLFDYVVVNRDGKLDAAAEQVAMIMQVEHLRTHPRRVRL